MVKTTEYSCKRCGHIYRVICEDTEKGCGVELVTKTKGYCAFCANHINSIQEAS